MQFLKTVGGLAILGIVAGLATLYSGLIDVGASNPHSAPVRWLLHTVMRRSVDFHSAGIKPPPLDSPEMVMMGFRHYREMCVGCHLAPGVDNSEIRQGLTPRPPVLQKAVPHLTPAELFWVVKHGVKMTGMPAWGATHSDDKLWAIVAFLEKLPDMTPAQYKEMDRKAGPGDGDEDEEHDHAH
jgi:mono/diheme cytochrome c family protein